MGTLTLLLYLRNDPENSLASRIAYLRKGNRMPPLEGRDDAILISDNAVLFDKTKAHHIFVQLCAALAEAKWPYLLLTMDAESAMAVGKFSKEVEAILSAYGVPCVPPS